MQALCQTMSTVSFVVGKCVRWCGHKVCICFVSHRQPALYGEFDIEAASVIPSLRMLSSVRCVRR